MRMMRLIHLTSFGLLMLSACQSGSSEKKEAALIRLQKQQAALESRIRSLQVELGQTNTVMAKPVEVQSVEPGFFERIVLVQGMVDGDAILAVNPQVPGAITALYGKVGKFVRKGEILARIDDTLLQRSLEQMGKNLELANTTYERQKQLWEEKLGSEIQYLQAKNAREALEAGIAGLKQQIDMCLIKAPIDGTIEEAPLRIGEVVSTSTLAFLMTNFKTLKVVADVSELYSSRVKPGDPVNVIFPDLADSLTTRITSVSNYIHPGNRTFSIELLLPENIGGIKANMVAKVGIRDYTNPSVISLPVNVVIREGDQQNYVFVVEEENGTPLARKRYVNTGVYSGSRVEILDGLSSGERVVVTGQQLLTDMAPITIVQ